MQKPGKTLVIWGEIRTFVHNPVPREPLYMGGSFDLPPYISIRAAWAKSKLLLLIFYPGLSEARVGITFRGLPTTYEDT